MNSKVKIGSIILFTTVVLVVISLALTLDSSKGEEIKFIELKGNYHLSQNEYLKFAMLENQEEYGALSPKIIKDRLEKHPYVKNADLVLENNTLNIEIFEKNFEALLMINEKEYLITDNAVIIPKLPHSEKIDYPIISDPGEAKEINEFSKATSNNDIKIALKMIAAFKIINPNLYENLSEINLRDGKDILMQLANIDAPVIVGRKREIEKIILLEKLIQKLDYSKIKNRLNYIDLRYAKYLYVGKSNSINSEQEITS